MKSLTFSHLFKVLTACLGIALSHMCGNSIFVPWIVSHPCKNLMKTENGRTVCKNVATAKFLRQKIVAPMNMDIRFFKYQSSPFTRSCSLRYLGPRAYIYPSPMDKQTGISLQF